MFRTQNSFFRGLPSSWLYRAMILDESGGGHSWHLGCEGATHCRTLSTPRSLDW